MNYDLIDGREPPRKRAPNVMSKQVFDELMDATARAIKQHTEHLTKRIEQLENDLAYARSEAAKALDADLDRFIAPPEDEDMATRVVREAVEKGEI